MKIKALCGLMTSIIKPKSCGSGLMVSDFVEEYGGFLELSDEELLVRRKRRTQKLNSVPEGWQGGSNWQGNPIS